MEPQNSQLIKESIDRLRRVSINFVVERDNMVTEANREKQKGNEVGHDVAIARSLILGQMIADCDATIATLGEIKYKASGLEKIDAIEAANFENQIIKANEEKSQFEAALNALDTQSPSYEEDRKPLQAEIDRLAAEITDHETKKGALPGE